MVCPCLVGGRLHAPTTCWDLGSRATTTPRGHIVQSLVRYKDSSGSETTNTRSATLPKREDTRPASLPHILKTFSYQLHHNRDLRRAGVNEYYSNFMVITAFPVIYFLKFRLLAYVLLFGVSPLFNWTILVHFHGLFFYFKWQNSIKEKQESLKSVYSLRWSRLFFAGEVPVVLESLVAIAFLFEAALRGFLETGGTGESFVSPGS